MLENKQAEIARVRQQGLAESFDWALEKLRQVWMKKETQ
ncbi:MAG: hypothetical protein CM15mV88_420 [Caudoviricetes sp.]|nr:MAG: hypothetical protein CM15mV88_420 [Caudoviricetes sp.]